MQNSSKNTNTNCDKKINAQIKNETTVPDRDIPNNRNITPENGTPSNNSGNQNRSIPIDITTPPTNTPMNNRTSTPTPGMPMNNRTSTPTPGMPMNGMPMDGMPMNGMPMDGMPINGVPMYPLYGYDNSEDLDRDMEYFKQLYPRTVRQIQNEVDYECDRLEYDGSVMFDEYPDRVTLDRIVDRIYEKVESINETPAVEANNLYYPQRRRQNNLARDLISIILLNEFLGRRRRYRSRRRWF